MMTNDQSHQPISTGQQSQSALMEPQTPFGGLITEMFGCIELARPAAIEVSSNIWPHCLNGLQNVTDYLKWHGKVCPGGGLHPHDGSSQSPNLSIGGKSIKDLSQALILRMDHFHHRGANPDPTSSTKSQVPEAAPYDSFASLGVFFNGI